MTTALAVANQAGGELSMYDRVDPLDFVEKIGNVLAQSGACGCKTPADGKLVALACLCERKSPFDIGRRYHLMDGKLSVKADVMLADLRAAGGTFKWISDGKGDGPAVIELSFKGNVYVSSYGMEDAQRAGLVKEKGGWQKNPANMKRARAVSDGMRIIAPEISAGVYTPEENEDIASDGVPVAAAPAATKRATKAEQDARKAELQAQQNQPAAPTTQTVTPTVVETTAQPAAAVQPPTTTDTSAITEPAADPKAAVVAKLEALCVRFGVTVTQLEDSLRPKNPGFTTIAALTAEQAERIVANLESRAAAAGK